MVFEWFQQVFRTPGQKVAAFCRGRSRQPDNQFIANCGLPPEPEAARVAIAVRRAVGRVGSVDPEFIYADDAYPDQLGVLPLWDSMSWVEFFLALEVELGLRISEREAEQFIDPQRVSVREMVIGVYRTVTGRRTVSGE